MTPRKSQALGESRGLFIAIPWAPRRRNSCPRRRNRRSPTLSTKSIHALPAAITSGGVPPVALECFLTSKVDWNMVA
nr:MAG TPA: hypothetical protein [Caudoviricetes sp.]